MALPFPGMNPYLEHPNLWSEVHSWLIVELARSLNPSLVPKYRAAVEKRVYLDALLLGIPDTSVFPRSRIAPRESQSPLPQRLTSTGVISQPVHVRVPMSEEVTERYLEIREINTEQVITVVEILSPKNKRTGEGRTRYLSKRQSVLGSATHFVEIDLLRNGELMPMAGAIASDYRILVSRASLRPDAELYPFNLRDPIPQFLLPLKSADEEPVVDLGEVLKQVYEQAGLDLAIDYSVQPEPPLNENDFGWVQGLVR